MGKQQRQVSWAEVKRALETASRAHRDGDGGLNWSDASKILAYICVAGSAAFWIPVQLDLASPIGSWREWLIAVMFGAFMVIGPPVFIAPFTPRSRIQQFLLELNALTIGRALSLGIGVYLAYYAFQIQYAWWAGRPNVAQTGMLTWQAILGLIFTVAAPTLLIAAASMREANEELEREQAYEKMRRTYRNRQALLALQHRNAVRLMRRGLAELAPRELEELTGYMAKLDAEDAAAAREVSEIQQQIGVLGEIREITGGDPELSDRIDFLALVAEELAPETRRQIAAAGAAVQHVAERVVERVAAPAAAPAFDRGMYDRAREALSDKPIWTREELQAELTCGKTTAADLIGAWRAAGLVVEHQQPRYRYSFR